MANEEVLNQLLQKPQKMPTMMEQFESSMNPLQKIVFDSVKKNVGKQVEQRLSSGEDPGKLLDEHGLINPMQQQMQSQQNMGLQPNIFTAMMMGGQGLQGKDPTEVLKNLMSLKRTPLEMQAEQRRLEQEERIQKESFRQSVRQFGTNVKESDISNLQNEYNIDANTMVETYGIPAKIDPKTGERSWNLPDMYTQATMARNKPITDKEQEYIGDRLDAIDTTNEIIDDLSKLGIKDPSQIGNFEIPEGFWSDMGPMSIPARFNLVGQYAKDPKYTAVKSKIERVFQKYRKVTTGAQASTTELGMLRPLIESMIQRPGVFFQIAKDLNNENQRTIDTRLQLMESAGRDISKIKGMLEKRTNKKSVSNMESEISKMSDEELKSIIAGGK